jgi:hypothetical protein
VPTTIHLYADHRRREPRSSTPLVDCLAGDLGGNTEGVMLDAAVPSHSVFARIVVIVIGVLTLGLIVFVTWTMFGALRRLPMKPLSGRQRVIALAFLASEVCVTALGVLLGYLAAGAGHKGEGMLVGGIAGAFTWLAMCWIVGGLARLRRT